MSKLFYLPTLAALTLIILMSGVVFAAGPPLSFVEVIKDGGTDAASNPINGLNDGRSVKVSPDGKHVYVMGSVDNSMTVFDRNALTGVLTFVEVLTDASTDAVGNTIDGLFGGMSV